MNCFVFEILILSKFEVLTRARKSGLRINFLFLSPALYFKYCHVHKVRPKDDRANHAVSHSHREVCTLTAKYAYRDGLVAVRDVQFCVQQWLTELQLEITP
jgi:hypothetical protein